MEIEKEGGLIGKQENSGPEFLSKKFWLLAAGLSVALAGGVYIAVRSFERKYTLPGR